MKFLVINWRDIYHPQAGGAEVYIHEIMRRLAQRGHEPVMLSCEVPGRPPEEVIDGVRVVRRGKHLTFNLSVPGAWRELRKEGFDAVVEDLNKLPFYSKLYIKDVPLGVISMHFFGKTIFQEFPWPIASYVYLHENLIRFFYKNLPFAALSESTAEDLRRWGLGTERLFIVYPGTDFSRYSPGPKAPEPTVLYLGRLKRYKRIDLAMRAMALAKDRVPGLKFFIVGKGDAEPRLRQLARKLGMESYTRFLGFVSEEEKARLLREAWVLINTSPKEGWGLVNTEAEASGTPVVAFDAPGVRESVAHGETGFLIPWGDVEGLADALVRVLTDQELRRRLSEKASQWVRRFSWERAAEAFEEFLSYIIDYFGGRKR